MIFYIHSLHNFHDIASSGVGIVISEEISKEFVRVEMWKGRIIVAWARIRKQLVCVMSVYGPQTGPERTEAEPETRVHRCIGDVDRNGRVRNTAMYCRRLQCPYRRNSATRRGKYGLGTRNREDQPLVELMARNGLAFVGSFFQKLESHKITYSSEHHKI